MSRSNPSEHGTHPCQRWIQWRGGDGLLSYWDKTRDGGKGANVEVPMPFTFLVLDKLFVIKGFNDSAQSGITSNEVKDLATTPMTVRIFGKGVIAEGLYSEIKEKVMNKSVGGQFTVNLYVAFKGDNGKLQLGSVQFSGCSLGPWIDFEKKHKGAVWSQAVVVTGRGEMQKKGKVEFYPPTLALKPASPETDAEAKALDAMVLKPYLERYLARDHASPVQGSGRSERAPTATRERDPDADYETRRETQDSDPSDGGFDPDSYQAPPEDDLPF